MPSWNRPTATSRGSPRCSSSWMASSYAAAASSSRPSARRASARSVRQTEAILAALRSPASARRWNRVRASSSGPSAAWASPLMLQGPAEMAMAHRQVVGRALVGRLAGRHRLGEEPPRQRYGFRRPAGIDQPIDGGRSGQVAGVAPAGILQGRGRALAHRHRALESTGPAQVLKQGLHRVCLVDHRLHADRAARRGASSATRAPPAGWAAPGA